MSKLSTTLQTQSLKEMGLREPYIKKLAGFEYKVLPKVYKGSTDTELFCEILKIETDQDVWDIGTGTGLIALHAKRSGAKYVLATDLNPDAIKNAKEDSRLLGIEIDIKQVDLFGSIKRKFDIITFNPPFTDKAPKQSHDISFWDKDNKTVRKFFQGVKKYLKPEGKAFIAWSSFGDVRKLKRIASEHNLSLTEVGKRRGKRGFIYYVFVIKAQIC